MKRIFYGIILTIVVVSVAYIAGTEASNYFVNKRISAQREKINNNPIMNLNDLEVGDKLPDATFENLSFTKTSLSENIYGKTIITFMSPTCNSCLGDIKFIYENIPNEDYYNKFVYISFGNPRQLMDIQNEFNVKSPILYDHNGVYCTQFDITVFPLHMLVDSSLTILDIYAGSITENDINKVL